MDRMSSPIWRVRILETGEEWEGPLEAYWEVHSDPISAEYTPDEVDAVELLKLWAQEVREIHPSGLIPIDWFVESKGLSKFEGMPFQSPHSGEEVEREDFLTFYDWPIDMVTGERLNWLTLPVVDKLWRDKRMDKGGFIQEATNWKPSILQPFVYLDSLLGGIGLVGASSRQPHRAV